MQPTNGPWGRSLGLGPHCELWEAAGGGLGSRAWPACASGGRCCHRSGPAAGARADPSPPATARAWGPRRPRCLSSIARTPGSSARHTRQVGSGAPGPAAVPGVGGEGAACSCRGSSPGSAGPGSAGKRRVGGFAAWQHRGASLRVLANGVQRGLRRGGGGYHGEER